MVRSFIFTGTLALAFVAGCAPASRYDISFPAAERKDDWNVRCRQDQQDAQPLICTLTDEVTGAKVFVRHKMTAYDSPFMEAMAARDRWHSHGYEVTDPEPACESAHYVSFRTARAENAKRGMIAAMGGGNDLILIVASWPEKAETVALPRVQQVLASYRFDTHSVRR